MRFQVYFDALGTLEMQDLADGGERQRKLNFYYLRLYQKDHQLLSLPVVNFIDP
jgi:hypothetical protein